MASIEFPENERDTEMADDTNTTPAEKAADSQPSVQDYSTEDVWDLNRKLLYSAEQQDNRVLGMGQAYDGRVVNLNQKVVGDAQAQAIFWQNIQERQLALKMASQELKERQDAHTVNMQRAWQSVDHQATLNNVDYDKARMLAPVELRIVEPTREENLADSIAGAVTQGVESVARAQTDRTQTSAANLMETTAARQVADVNVLNTLSEVAGIVQSMQTQSATSQAAFQALSNQVSELVGVVQALTGNQPRA